MFASFFAPFSSLFKLLSLPRFGVVSHWRRPKPLVTERIGKTTGQRKEFYWLRGLYETSAMCRISCFNAKTKNSRNVFCRAHSQWW